MVVWDWLQHNATLLSGLGNWLLVTIWAVYLHMFYRQSRRHHKPVLLIHHAQGSEPSANCLLVNMSKEIIHVQCVIAEIETPQERRVHQVTQYHRVQTDDPEAQQRLRQGPLQPGEYLLLGRLEDLLSGLESQQNQIGDQQDSPPRLTDVRAMELRAVAVHGPGEDLIGARRRFAVEHRRDQTRIHPDRLLTDQLTSRRHQRLLARWLRDSLAQSSQTDWPRPASHSIQPAS